MAEVSIVSALAGFVLGLVPTFYNIAKDNAAQQQKIMDYLMERKLALDGDFGLLPTIYFLKTERERKRRNQPPPELPNDLDPMQMRKLPAFLEPIGTYLEFNPSTFEKAYGVFAEEVLLCAGSDMLWSDENPQERSVYWRSFDRFVKATKDHGFGEL